MGLLSPMCYLSKFLSLHPSLFFYILLGNFIYIVWMNDSDSQRVNGSLNKAEKKVSMFKAEIGFLNMVILILIETNILL